MGMLKLNIVEGAAMIIRPRTLNNNNNNNLYFTPEANISSLQFRIN